MKNSKHKFYFLNQHGFTMLEIIIAVSILAAIALTMTQITDSMIKITDDVSSRNESRHTAMMGISKLSDDLRMAFLVDTKNYGTEGFYKTGFVGTTTEVNFSTMSNVHYVKNKKDTDQIQVGYVLSADEQGTFNLMRRQTDYLTDKLTSGGQGFILVSDIKEFKLQYYDANKKEWEDAWDTESVSVAGALPSMVRIKLTVLGAASEDAKDPNDREEFNYELVVPVELYATKLGS